MKTERFKTFAAVMIALVTIASALVAWRAAVASGDANQADFSGLAAAVNAEEEQVLNEIAVSEHYQAFLMYTRYNELGNRLQEAIDAAGSGEAIASLQQVKSDSWGIAYGLQSLFFPSRYLRPDGSFDSQREMQEKTADSERRRDVKPGLHFARADRLRVKANWLVVTLVFLGFSLWMFTCAQIIQRGLRYVFALGGMFFFAGSVLAAFLIACVAVLAAVITFLQTYSSGEGDKADRTSTQFVIQAMQVRTGGETRLSHEWQGAYQTWYELDLQALAADLAGDKAAAGRYRLVRDRIAGLSPILSAQYFDPASGNTPDYSGYQADAYIVESTRLTEMFAAYNKIGDAWGDRSKALIVHLMLLAVSLALFGLSTTIQGFMRRAFVALGSLISLVVFVWAFLVMIKPPPQVPQAAIEAYSQGVGLAWRGDYPAAVEQFNAALAAEPGYANALYERGNAHYWAGDFPAALADYEASVRAGREDTNAGWNLGWTYYLLGRFDDAIRVDRAVLEQDSSLIGVQFNLALALMVNGQLQEAEAEYRKGVDQAIGEMGSAQQAGAQPPSSFWEYMDASAADIENLVNAMDGALKPWGLAPGPSAIRADRVQMRALADRMFYLLKDTTVALEFTGQAPPQTARGTATAFEFGTEELDDQGNFVRYNIAKSFAFGLNELQVLFDYGGMRKGALEVWKIYRDGVENPTLRVTSEWALEESGSAAKPISYAYSDLFVFTSGEYTVEFYLDSHLIGRGTFTVEEPQE